MDHDPAGGWLNFMPPDHDPAGGWLNFMPPPKPKQGGIVSVSFDDRSSDPDGRVVAWSWNFGDGETSGDQYPTHTYRAPGAYQVRLDVTDDSGLVASTTRLYTVEDAPTVDFAWDPPQPVEGDASTNKRWFEYLEQVRAFRALYAAASAAFRAGKMSVAFPPWSFRPSTYVRQGLIAT
ncbi:MAG: PKD domain-containing protein [Deltaproteobacteria bacterium]|nr:PKD domain-containing protein [Deltaproteobacteria bacterium]